MPTTETNVRNLRINRLTNEQYETAVKSDTELYLTPDTTDADIASAIAAHNSDTTSHSNKQDKLTTQTAYSAKGSATKVPQITTNSLGQVTAITEVTITQPTVNNATLTIQKNGTTVNTFTANASSNVTANITVPTTAADVNAVPTTRTVNSKALSSDITLTASDVGAVATADGVTAVVAGSTDDKINVTKNGSTTTLTINNVANANLAKSVYSVVSAGSTLDIVKASVGTNDYARIQVGGAANAGYLEIATADDANEPIYVRQYTGNFATKTRTLTLLDGSGHTSFPGIVSATGGFNGDNSLLWGGPNIVNGIAPSDTGSIDDHGHNKLSYFAGIIKVEYSTNGGTTWTTPEELTTESKFRLTTLGGLSIRIGNVTTTGVITNDNVANYKARITLCSRNSSGTGVFYSSIRKLLLNVGTAGATGCKVKVERKLISDYNAGNDTWTLNGTYDVGGWTGWNSIPCNFAFGGGSNQTTQTAELRLTLEATGTGTNTANTNAFSINDIRMIGLSNWNVDNFAATGHLYTPDYNKNATFPQRVVANGGFTGDLTGNVTGNVTGDLTGNADTATKATELYENDTRSTNETPLWYSSNHPRSITTEFKSLSKIGITGNGNYGQLVTYTTWTDASGGYPTQICICSGNGKMFKRNGTANTTWGAWKEIATTDSVGTVTGVTAGAGLNTTSNDTATDGGTISTSGTLYLTKSGVTAGTYQGITVDKYGRVTGASNQGYTTNTGTVTSVRVQAGTGLTSSQNTAQTSTLNTTIGIDSNYKLPTTTEWNNKQDTINDLNYLREQASKVDNAITSLDISDSGSSLPSTSGFNLNDTFLNTTDKKLYTTLAPAYQLGPNVSNGVNVDLNTGIASGFYSETSGPGYSVGIENSGQNIVWENNVTVRMHFKFTSIPSNSKRYVIFALKSYASGTPGSNKAALICLISGQIHIVLLTVNGYGTITTTSDDILFNTVLSDNVEYYLEISKVGTLATGVLSTGGYNTNVIESNSVATQDYKFPTSNSVAYGGTPNFPESCTTMQIYLADSTGNFLVADGTLTWDSGVNLANNIQYNDQTNKKTLYYNNNILYESGMVDTDNSTITKNSSNQIQTVGYKDVRTNNTLKTWTGTREQYDAITTKDANTLYNITNDSNNNDILAMLSAMYPVGAIYIGTMNTCPLATLGIGTWEKVATDRVLQGAGTRGNVGTTINESLPNIKGNVYNIGGVPNTTGITADGAFSRVSASSSTGMSTGGSDTYVRVDINASRSSSTYQDNAPVQQNAYLVNVWRRTA